MSEDLSDAPLRKPIEDLLGVQERARVLAQRLCNVEPPFTVGIYGEWGSGKTSFVWFVAYFLQELTRQDPSAKPFLFVPFSAWEHKTGDEILRALILEVARALLDFDQPPPEEPPRRLSVRVKRFLSKEAFVIKAGDKVRDAQATYDSIVAKLDASLYGGISKSPDSPAGFNGQDAAMAVTKGVVSAMAGLSPLVAGLKSFFGDTEIDPGALLEKSENRSTRQRIQSLRAFREELLDELYRCVGNRRVFVFIDDLDRCMPDAALDLLEAIKIFLQEAPFVFIVAVDKKLISQGLRMRLRHLPEFNRADNLDEILTEKGDEYFEKIVQFELRLPRASADEVHRFITGWFPAFMAASDVIENAVGSNPRRLKQYCHRLEYLSMVSGH